MNCAYKLLEPTLFFNLYTKSHLVQYRSTEYMGERFQDYSWIQDFEADSPQKVSLKMLDMADFNSFSDLF